MRRSPGPGRAARALLPGHGRCWPTRAPARSGCERAIAEFRAELALAPEDALASDQLGSALLEAGRPAEALPAFEAAARGEARFLYLFHLGRCQLALDRPRDAARRCVARSRLAGEQGAGDSDVEKIHYQLGLGLRKLGATEEAATHLAEAPAARPRAAAAGADHGPPVGHAHRCPS